MDLNWTENSDPFSKLFDDRYYADEDGLAESRYVFLQQNSLAERFSRGGIFSIGELGFGTGLNFFAAWDLWRKTSKPPDYLHFVSCEKFPLSADQISKAMARWPELTEMVSVFLSKYSELPPGFHRLRFEEDRVVLTLLVGDALKSLRELEGKMDAWFFDGFAPRKNPEMWSDEIFREVAGHSKSEATFATYTSAGFVRRNLEAAGFGVEKFQGFGRKRDMVKGRLKIDVPAAAYAAPKLASVIGGGISGVMAATALAKRGCRVRVFEKAKIASAASANRAAINMPVLSAVPNTLSQVSLRGFCYFQNLEGFQKHGILKLSEGDVELQKWNRGLLAHEIPTSLAQIVEPSEAAALAGIPILQKAIYFPRGGILNLPEFCWSELRKYSEQIEVLEDTSIQSWDSDELVSTDGRRFPTGDLLVLANAHEISNTALPLRKVRGQSVYLNSKSKLCELKTILCFEGFITPALSDGTQLLGATYDNTNYSKAPLASETHQLLRQLTTAIPYFANEEFELSSTWVDLRTNVPGMTPVMGALLSGSRPTYIASAFSSRGSLYAPLAGELIASHAFGEPIPLERSLLKQLSPQRF